MKRLPTAKAIETVVKRLNKKKKLSNKAYTPRQAKKSLAKKKSTRKKA